MKTPKIFIGLIACMLPTIVGAQNEDRNRTVDGVRQGLWYIEGKEGKVEEGTYIDGKRHGVWKTYLPDGTIKSSVTYDNGQAKGETILYFDDGTVMEKGYWNVDHWEGDYERYHANGKKACKFNYNERGLRQGQQIYFHDNGKVMYEGTWAQGKIAGQLAIYNTDGIKVMERTYDSGSFVGVVEVKQEPGGDLHRNFTETGQFTLYNLNGKVDQKGYFVKGVLQNGEKYIYRDNGSLSHIEVYENFKLKGRK